MHIPPHILIVDADTSAARVTRTLVERVEPHATLAVEANAERGRLSARNHRPDILIIDPSPYSRGDELLVKQIKAEFPGARVIVLTSSPTSALRRRMHALGADLYIEKPAPPNTLVDGLRTLLVGNETRARER